MRVADQLQKDAALRRQIKAAMIYPILVIIFAVGVMMALVAFLVPVFVGVFKQFGGELPTLTQVSVVHVEGRHRLLVADVPHDRRDRRQLHQVEENDLGSQAVGSLPAARADEDRHDRPAGRRRALVAHAGLADGRRRAAAAGARDHRPHRRQRRGRGGDGRRDRLGQARRHDRRAARTGADLPRDGDPHGRRRRGNRRARHDARPGRGVLRGTGRSVGQGADLDPRADHDHRDRRDRRASS